MGQILKYYFLEFHAKLLTDMSRMKYKKFELMLTRHAKAYNSFGSVF